MSAVGSAYARSVIPSEDRERDDFYPTPPAGTQALLSVERFDGQIWEPACGQGHISRVLIEHGYEVYSSDLINRGYGESPVDFLLDWQTKAANVITNPPFKFVMEFTEHALRRTTGKVAMLARLGWLEGSQRKAFFESSPLARVWVFSRRLAMQRNGEPRREGGAGGMIAFAWYVWEHGYKGKPTLGWLDHQNIYDPAENSRRSVEAAWGALAARQKP